jgi:hypothetical protein
MLSDKWLNSIFRFKMRDLWLSEMDINFGYVFRVSRFSEPFRVILLVVIFGSVSDSQFHLCMQHEYMMP